MVNIPTIPAIPKNITCKFGYHPIVIFATKGGRPLSGATVKFESAALILGKKPLIRTTNAAGIAHACFLHFSYGKVSIYHPHNDFGYGKGKWKTLKTISSLRKPTALNAVVVPPTPVPYIPKITVPVKPIPDITDIIPKMPDITDIIPKMSDIVDVVDKLPTGRVGAVVRLTMRNYMDDKPTLIGGTYWGARGASNTSAKIAQVTPDKKIIELQRSIDIGETRKFKSGFSVRVVRSRGGYPDAYADVIVTPSPTDKIIEDIEDIIDIIPEKKYKRITRILSDGQDLPRANKGETVRITAESYCVVNGKIDKSKVPSILIIDGAIAARKPVVDGIVSYEWTATSIPPRHTICVQINPTDICKSIGRDCKKISVSSKELDLSEQLLRERTSAKEQRDLIRLSRTKLREEIVGAIREAPVYEAPAPTPIPMPIVTPPVTPIEKPIVPPKGNIKLTGLPLSVPDDVPAYIYVDNINKGKITSVPMTLTLIPVGTHSVYIMAGEFKSITKIAEVIENETTNVSLL